MTRIRTTTAVLAAAATVAAVALVAPSAGAHDRGDRHYMRRTIAPYRAFFERVAVCESHGQWHINTGNSYYGGLQFSLPAWQAVGGRGYPHEASKLEQIYRGVLLLRVQGAGAWPICGRTA